MGRTQDHGRGEKRKRIILALGFKVLIQSPDLPLPAMQTILFLQLVYIV